jgi:iron complex transport system substrate-binding protein
LYQPRSARSSNRAPAALAFVALLLAACGDAAPRGGPLGAPQPLDADVLAGIALPSLAFDRPPPDDAPRRIVSVIPSGTEIVFTLGLGDRVVGRSDWCDWPSEAATRPALGDQQTLSVERIADLRPDLVVFWKHLEDKARVLEEDFGLRVVSPGTESRSEILDGIRLVAGACRVPERGERLVRHLEQGLEAVRGRCERLRKVRTLVVLDRSQAFYVPGRQSFMQEVFDIAGVESVSASLDAGRWPAVTLEQVLDWNPELVLDLSLGTSGGPAEVAAARRYWAGHATLDAVARGRVFVLNAGVLVRPGPRLAAVTEALAGIVHGPG